MNIIYIERTNGGQMAHIAVTSRAFDNTTEITEVIETCYLWPGRYVRINDGNNYPQLCQNAQRMGWTIEYSTDEALAHQCYAYLCNSRAEFNELVSVAQGEQL